MYSPRKCVDIILACAILHNICIEFDEPHDLPHPLENLDQDEVQEMERIVHEVMQECTGLQSLGGPSSGSVRSVLQGGRKNQTAVVNTFM